MVDSLPLVQGVITSLAVSYGERKEGLVNVVQGFGHACVNRDNFKGRYLLNFM